MDYATKRVARTNSSGGDDDAFCARTASYKRAKNLSWYHVQQASRFIVDEK